MVDTERKRRSTVPHQIPRPDDEIDAGDRRTLSDVYDPTTPPPAATGGLDSPTKRRSATPGTFPKADGTIDAGDRRHATAVYDPTEHADLTPDTGTAILAITAVRNRVDSKISRDRGRGTSSASGAVTVTFNKEFADIITLDAFPVTNTGQKIFRVIDFVDAPDPVSFDLRFFDHSGTQLALDFGWDASGILKSG